MSWVMSDDEIRSMWRTCKNRNEQVNILADLNVVTRAEAVDKLRELGCDMRGVRTGKRGGAPKKPPMDELRAMELYREGLDDLAISEALGETQNRVKEWRRRMKLPTVKKECEKSESVAEATENPAEKEKKMSAQTPKAMSALALAGILERVKDGYDGNGVLVMADGTEVSRAVVDVTYSCTGEVEQVRLHLLSK